ncbi:MAG TPA: hypothetical protein DIT43_00140 [Dehalococcoidia bacterium]|nr:hypothetical protein [Dehalococcoidia bacterium]
MTTDKNNELPNIIKLESLSQEETKRKHWREIELFAEILNVFTSGFSYMGSFEIKEDNETEYIWLLIVTRCFHSIRCSINLMLKGYYSQAMSLLRTGTEDWFICGTCHNNEKVRSCLLRGKWRTPKYSRLAKQMGATDVYKGDYAYQSKFTHSSRLSLRVLQDVNTNEMRTAPIYDKYLFLLCVESLVRVFFRMAVYMGRFLYYIDRDKAKAWDNENSQSFKDASNWLKELREKYGEDVDSTNHDLT